MKILSIDIGIKNLAYCILDLDNNNRFKIKGWNVINLDENRKYCEHIGNKNKKCEKSASYTIQNKLICKTHYQKYSIKYTKEDLVIKESNLMNCSHIFPSLKPCPKLATCSVNNNNYCDSHIDSNLKLINKQNNPTKLGAQNCNKIPVFTLATTLCKKLDDIPDLLQVNEVIIENQPSLKNPVMKNIASYVFMYFIIKGISTGLIKNIKLYSPSNKLKIADSHILDTKKETLKDLPEQGVQKVGSDGGLLKDGLPEDGLPKEKSKQTAKTDRQIYTMTKNLGKTYCVRLITEFKDKLDFYNNNKKKDDLADCLIQGFHYLYSETGITPYYKNLLEN